MFQAIFNFPPFSSICWQSHTLPKSQDQLTQFQNQGLDIHKDKRPLLWRENTQNSFQLMSVLENVCVCVCVNVVQLCAYAYGSHTIKIAHSVTVIILFWELLGIPKCENLSRLWRNKGFPLPVSFSPFVSRSV